MRLFTLLALATLTGACTAPAVEAPSLAPRLAESIDPRVPISSEPIAVADADPALIDRLNALIVQAVEGDRAFEAAAETARRLAESAGAKESESWVVAQEALSAAIEARAPVTRAVGDIDELGAERVVAGNGIGKSNLEAILAAAARVSEIDEREMATVGAIQSMLGR